ncbi:MAG: hypothetical protein AB7S78_02720 [Candidatus Omnitrophota bacterium]
MKKFIFIIFLAVISLTGLCPARAGTPQSMTLQYNLESQILSVEVYHLTDKRYGHYVNRYDIQVNGGTVSSFYQQGQESTGVALKNMPIRAAAGDTLEVSVACNENGSLKGILYLTDRYRLDNSAVYKSAVENPGYEEKRHRFKYDNHSYGYPYFKHRRGRHHRPDADPVPTDDADINVPKTNISPAKQHQLDVEQEINRKAYEAKFGPLKTPDQPENKR